MKESRDSEVINKIFSAFLDSLFFENLRKHTSENMGIRTPTQLIYLTRLIEILCCLIDKFPSKIAILPISDVITSSEFYLRLI